MNLDIRGTFFDIGNCFLQMWSNAFFRVLFKICIASISLFVTYGGIYLFLIAINAPAWMIEIPMAGLMLITAVGMIVTIIISEDVC